MESFSNQTQLDSTVENHSSSGNITNVENDDMVEDAFDPACHEMLEELIEGFDESFNRNTQKEGTHETIMSKHSDSETETSHSFSFVGMEVRRRNTVTKKCGCAAKIILKYIGPDSPDKYVIFGFIEGHNHSLASESGKEFLRANRTMTTFQRHFLLDAVKSNMGAFRAHTMHKSLFGLYSKVFPTAMDFQNWMRDIKLYIGKHDADMLL
ncbi:hypothetical protein AgCh_036325 [Apium graveolens]